MADGEKGKDVVIGRRESAICLCLFQKKKVLLFLIKKSCIVHNLVGVIFLS